MNATHGQQQNKAVDMGDSKFKVNKRKLGAFFLNQNKSFFCSLINRLFSFIF